MVQWYQIYLLNPVMDRTEAIIFQHLYLNRIIESTKKEVKFCDRYQGKNEQIKVLVIFHLNYQNKYQGKALSRINSPLEYM